MAGLGGGALGGSAVAGLAADGGVAGDGFAVVGAAADTAVSPAGTEVAAGAAAVSVSATAPADAWSDLPLHAVSDIDVSANKHVAATMCPARGASGRALMFPSLVTGRRRRPAMSA